MDTRACKICQEVKPLTNSNHFTKDNKIYHKTLRKECKKIARAPDQKAYREANKEKLAQKKKEWVENNKEHCKEVRKQYYEVNKEKLSEKGAKLKLLAQFVLVKFERINTTHGNP